MDENARFRFESFHRARFAPSRVRQLMQHSAAEMKVPEKCQIIMSGISKLYVFDIIRSGMHPSILLNDFIVLVVPNNLLVLVMMVFFSPHYLWSMFSTKNHGRTRRNGSYTSSAFT